MKKLVVLLAGLSFFAGSLTLTLAQDKVKDKAPTKPKGKKKKDGTPNKDKH